MPWNVVGSFQMPDQSHDDDHDWEHQWYKVGTTGPGGDTQVQTIVRIAGENIGGHRLVVPSIVDGEVEYASNLDTSNPTRPVWMSISAADQGDQVTLVAEGPVTETSWTWNEGPIFLGANGLMTQTPPMTGMVMVVAWALSPTKCVFDPNPPIVLAG